MCNWRPADTNMYGCTLPVRSDWYTCFYLSLSLLTLWSRRTVRYITVTNTQTMLQYHSNQFFLFISITNNFQFFLSSAHTQRRTYTVMCLCANISCWQIFVNSYYLCQCVLVCTCKCAACEVVWWQKFSLSRLASHRCTKWKENNYSKRNWRWVFSNTKKK